MTIVSTWAGDFEQPARVGPACAVLLDPRILIEMAAELDPDTYVPILDALDAELEDREEDDEREPAPVEEWFGERLVSVAPIPVYDRCPCCGNLAFNEEWTA